MSGDFDELLGDLRGALDGEISRERRTVAPDFAAVVAAARARDPKAISEAAVREAGELAPVVEIGAELDRGSESADAELDAWIADARELAEADVAARRLAGVPPLRQVDPEPEPGVRWWVPVVAIAAVVAGLAIAIPRLLDAFVDGNYQEASTPNQAEYVAPEPRERDASELPKLVAPEPVPQQAVPREPAPRESVAPSEAKPAPRPRPDHDAQQARDRIAELDAEAQALWAKGDLAGAEQRFRSIIALARAGQRRYADLAYGDLFTLARQRKDEAAERALWQEYLERFPKGRFADDARAGLCRRAAAAEREGCWQAYLDEFPSGVHTRVARRALGLDADPAESP